MRQLRSILALAVVAVAMLGAQTAAAQKFTWSVRGSNAPVPTTGAADVLKVNYFSNANISTAPDGTVQIMNPGSPTTNLCAQVYVFDPYQEMSECCACLITPDGLRTLSVNTDLTSNPLTGVTLGKGSVTIISGYTANNFNNPCSPLNNIVSPTLRAWGTHIYSYPNAPSGATYLMTESDYQDRSLGQWNDNLLIDCYAISLDGSGHGTCSCGTGD